MTERLDTLDMFGATMGLPEQIAQAVAGVKALEGPLPSHDEVENVVVLGMGGSGIGGDVMREIAGPFMAVPVVVHKGYGFPNFISESTLVFALSFSGATEETIEAAGQAAAAGGRLVCVSHGGELAELSDTWGAAHVQVADGIPMPRAGIGAIGIPPLLVLERIGLFPGASGWVDAAIVQLQARRDELLADDNAADQLARRIGRELPLVYGGAGLGGLAALRWKNQVNENAKAPAFWNQLPELCHNELAGWGQHGDVTRQLLRLVCLRHDFEHPQIARRFDIVAEVLEEVVSGVEEVHAQGEGPLAQLFDLMFFGDVTTLHLAYQAGVDPGPIAVLDEMKARLSEEN